MGFFKRYILFPIMWCIVWPIAMPMVALIDGLKHSWYQFKVYCNRWLFIGRHYFNRKKG